VARKFLTALPAVVTLSLLSLAVHFAARSGYGVFRDEFYYLECARHLAWGYVDHPPFSILLLRVWTDVFGVSVFALRVLPALAGAVLVFMTAVLAAELGGGRFAQVMAALSTLIAPGFLVITGFYSMNAFELLFWIFCYYVVIRTVVSGRRRLWLAVGVLIGVGMMNKISMMVFGSSLILARLLSPHRKHLLDRYFWFGVAIALLLFLPHLIWQIQNGWPTLEFIRNAKAEKIAPFTPIQFLTSQFLNMNPSNLLVWASGLLFLLFAPSMKRFRFLGLMFVITFLTLALQRSKPYYLLTAFPVLLAAGSVAFERFMDARRWRWIRPAAFVALAAGGLFTLPLAVPVLPVETLIMYEQAVGLMPPSEENAELADLPQYYADRFGWRELTERVASVYATLDATEQSRCTIVTGNYGEAGAINYYGDAYGLPRAVSQHNNYFLWGFGDGDGDVVLTVGIPPGDLEGAFEEVVHVPVGLTSKYAMPYEARPVICICRRLRVPLEKVWRAGKHFI
jgi:4-amino-4-deoxy-L-arabinose transferase-like glycosyltransferase